MQDILTVSRFQCLCNQDAYFKRIIHGQSSSAQTLRQRLAFNEFQNQKMGSLGFL